MAPEYKNPDNCEKCRFGAALSSVPAAEIKLRGVDFSDEDVQDLVICQRFPPQWITPSICRQPLVSKINSCGEWRCK